MVCKEAVVFIEGGLRPLSSSKEEAIKSWSEAGILTYLASEAGIPILSPEPTAQAEQEYIMRHCTEEEMMLYHVSCIADQWGTIKPQESFETYVGRFLRKDYLHLTFDMYCDLYKKVTGEEIFPDSLHIRKHLHPWGHVSAINKAAYFSTRCRNLCLLENIYEHLQNSDVFVAYGIGHGVVVEYVLGKV